MYTVSLMAAPARADLDDDTIAALQRRWGGGSALWLDQGTAVEFAIPAWPEDFDAAWAEADAQGFDLAVQPTANRRKAVLLADMDSTMIEQECIDELADFAGLKDRIAAITERAMQGELDFESALRERVGLLKNLPEAAIAQCLEERIRPMPGARTLVSTLKSRGCHTVLVTGGFHSFADPVAELLGFDRVVGNRLGLHEGMLTGGLVGGIVDSSVKKKVLLEETERLGAEVFSLATGDGANDIPMIEAASYGIAYRAKPKARSAADGWIDRGDLTSILSLLGIARQDWVFD